jgi:hypothetical protein
LRGVKEPPSNVLVRNHSKFSTVDSAAAINSDNTDGRREICGHFRYSALEKRATAMTGAVIDMTI